MTVHQSASGCRFTTRVRLRLRTMNRPVGFSTTSYLETLRITILRRTNRALAIMRPRGRRHSVLQVD
jgi:hypothetical protein